MKAMECDFPAQMRYFYHLMNHKKGNTPGNDFTGKILRAIMAEGSLDELSRILGAAGDLWINYIGCVREVYRTCVMKELDSEYGYEKAIFDYQDAFDLVHNAHDLSETLKVCFQRFDLAGF